MKLILEAGFRGRHKEDEMNNYLARRASLREAADVLRTDRRTRREEGTAMVNAKALRLRLKKHEVTKRNAQQKVCQIVTPKLFKT